MPHQVDRALTDLPRKLIIAQSRTEKARVFQAGLRNQRYRQPALNDLYLRDKIVGLIESFWQKARLLANRIGNTPGIIDAESERVQRLLRIFREYGSVLVQPELIPCPVE